MRLSVIIPVYNVEKYLARCIESVLLTDRADYEIIIVNDGSTDSSPDIARGYAEQYPALIRLISTPNGGLGHARNTGLDAATGDYVLFLDSDDRLSAGAMEEILNMADWSFDICIFDHVSVTEDDKFLKLNNGCDREGDFSLAEYPELLFQPPNACVKLFRRSLFGADIRFPGRMWFEDLYTIPKLYLRAARIRYLPKVWYEYLMRAGSITNCASIGRNAEIITAVNEVIGYYKASGLYEQYETQLEYMALYHELITSTTRVNLIDPDSDLQDKLLDDYTAKFPNYRQNPYVQRMPKKLKLLLRLIERRQHKAINLIMRANNKVKGK